MSLAVNAVNRKQRKIHMYKIERNGITKELTATVFGKKSLNAGKTFYTPEIDVANPDDVTWAGLDNINDPVNKEFRLIFADILIENLERNEGEFDEDEFLQDAAEFSAGRQNLQSVKDELEVLFEQQDTIARDDSFGITVDGTSESPLVPKAQELFLMMKSISEKIKPLKIKRAKIQATNALLAEKRAATKAAKKEKKASPVTA